MPFFCCCNAIQDNTIQYFINPFLLGFSGLIYIRLKIELNISNKIITYVIKLSIFYKYLHNLDSIK